VRQEIIFGKVLEYQRLLAANVECAHDKRAEVARLIAGADSDFIFDGGLIVLEPFVDATC
jgi:hypothetical protein